MYGLWWCECGVGVAVAAVVVVCMCVCAWVRVSVRECRWCGGGGGVGGTLPQKHGPFSKAHAEVIGISLGWSLVFL